MIKAFAKDLGQFERRGYSQTVEDGVLEAIFNFIGTTNKFFIEFGAWDGVHLSNTANFRLNHGWNGLLLEGNEEKAKLHPHVTHAFITAENINQLFEQNKVPKEYDLLSIDIDGNDFWIWKAIDENKFNARVVIVEFNQSIIDQDKSIAIKYDPNLLSTNPSIHYYGASIPAFHKLGKLKGYSLIRRVNIHNLIFVRSDLLHEDDKNLPVELFLNKNKKGIPVSRDLYTPDGPNGRCLHYPEMTVHWNEYANTNIVCVWPQDYTREWVTF